MTINPLSDRKIIDSWHKNAHPWTIAVRQGQISSRRLVTDRAIVDAVVERCPKKVLDLGCGEGWLARALSAKGIEVLGVDVVPELIEQARTAGGGRFELVSYEEIAAGSLNFNIGDNSPPANPSGYNGSPRVASQMDGVLDRGTALAAIFKIRLPGISARSNRGFVCI